jgi:hypothetical protein
MHTAEMQHSPQEEFVLGPKIKHVALIHKKKLKNKTCRSYEYNAGPKNIVQSKIWMLQFFLSIDIIHSKFSFYGNKS